MAMNGALELLHAFDLSPEKALKIKKKLLLQPINPQEKKQVIALKYFATGELTDEEYEKRLEKERADAEIAARAAKEAAEKAACEAAKKEKEIERLRLREIELLEKIASLLEKQTKD